MIAATVKVCVHYSLQRLQGQCWITGCRGYYFTIPTWLRTLPYRSQHHTAWHRLNMPYTAHLLMPDLCLKYLTGLLQPSQEDLENWQNQSTSSQKKRVMVVTGWRHQGRDGSFVTKGCDFVILFALPTAKGAPWKEWNSLPPPYLC